MKRRTNQLNNTILLALALLTFYSCEKNDIVTLTVINELQECEEENMFYKIIEVNSGVTEFKDDRDSLVLLLFEDSLSTNENYSYFFPSHTTKRKKVTIKGLFLNERISDNHSYGCSGSRKFRVNEIIKKEDVTDMEHFEVNYKN